jgi:hypothetical protein
LSDRDPSVHRPVGFGLFRAIGRSSSSSRASTEPGGSRHGRAMIAGLLAAGRDGRLIFCPRQHVWRKARDGAPAVSFGYTCVRETPQTRGTWQRDPTAPQNPYGVPAASPTAS